MSQNWMDDENAGAHSLPRSARKTTGDSDKKSVLGKLDNVLDNNTHLTPFNGDRAKWPPKMSQWREALQKHHRQQNKHNGPQSPGDHTGLDMFDYMDFPSKKCLENCQKPLSESRLEPGLSDDLANLEIQWNPVKSVDEMPYEIPVHPDFDADGFEVLEPLEPLELRIRETVDNFSYDIVEPMLPPLIETDLEEELFKYY